MATVILETLSWPRQLFFLSARFTKCCHGSQQTSSFWTFACLRFSRRCSQPSRCWYCYYYSVLTLTLFSILIWFFQKDVGHDTVLLDVQVSPSLLILSQFRPNGRKPHLRCFWRVAEDSALYIMMVVSLIACAWYCWCDGDLPLQLIQRLALGYPSYFIISYDCIINSGRTTKIPGLAVLVFFRQSHPFSPLYEHLWALICSL